MLQHTFLHVAGVGARTEAALWRSGATHWDAFAELHGQGRLTGRHCGRVEAALAPSRAALSARDVGHFWQSLPGREHWRLYEEFAGLAACVDIETTGLSCDGDDVTVVAVHAAGRTRTFVLGEDLEEFPAAAARYPLVVTFNGACFDLPFLARRFRGWRPAAHLDLRYPLRRLGYRGGLKNVERQAGIARPPQLRGLDGWDAVRLWHEHRRGSREARELLLAYAGADVENLVPLARLVASRLAAALGFAHRTCMWGGFCD